MGVCENLPTCPFFNDQLSGMPLVAGILKERYCLADSDSCARFIVTRTGVPVPLDLFPDDGERAFRIVEPREGDSR